MINKELLPILYQSSGTILIDEYMGHEVSESNEDSCIELHIVDILDLSKDMQSYVDKSVSTTASKYSYGNQVVQKEQLDDRTIYFYEWSDLNSKPLLFTKVSVFKTWCEKHNVNVSEYTIKTLMENKINYCACWNQSRYICIRETYEALNSAINYNCQYSQQNLYDNYDDWD